MNRPEAAAVADMAVTVAGLRAQLAELAAEAAVITKAVHDASAIANVITAISDEAFARGRGYVDDRQAEVNARKARAKFRLVSDNSPKPAPRSRARRKPGGAA